MPGLFITFEGIDGCGKTTQIKMLAALLAANSIPHLVTCEPGGTKIGSQIRQILLDNKNHQLSATTELLLYAADRAQHVSETLKPALDKNQIVLSDRYTDATLAYQGFGRKLSQPLIKELNKIATNSLIPDITILFDLPVPLANERMLSPSSERSKDRLENEKKEFHQRVREGYLSLAKEFPERFFIINTIDKEKAVFQEVCQVILPKINLLYPITNHVIK
ncbi:MAG: dTMP kinase [Acidobacteria bacterium]|nr:dTMP kinase [Acidobacteriota bacterium]